MERNKVAVSFAVAMALLSGFCCAADEGGLASKNAEYGLSPLLPVIISMFSLVIAVATFFLTQLRPARITSYVGPTVTLGYIASGGFGIAIPVTFTNHGVRPGVILRAGITIWRKDSPSDRYFMQWDTFVKQNFQTNSWESDEIAHALVVPGKSIVARCINCVWLPTNPQQMVFRPGTYSISFHYWLHESVSRGQTHEIIITEDMLTLLDSVDPASTRTTLVTLDETIRKNIHLNESEFKKLIEGKPV